MYFSEEQSPLPLQLLLCFIKCLSRRSHWDHIPSLLVLSDEFAAIAAMLVFGCWQWPG